MAESTTRVDWAVAQLSEGVMTGRLAPGERLKAQELAAEWGVSPTPVREALQRLTALGLVHAIPNRGVRVAPVAVEEMREVYSLRLLLEPFALRISLENRDAGWETAVRRAFAELEAQLVGSVNDRFVFEQAHSAFHAALLSRCGSAWMTRIIETLRTHSVRYRLLSLGPCGGRGDVLAEHRQLGRACLEGGVDEAVHRLFAHIRLTADSLVRDDSDTPDRLATLIGAAGEQMHGEAAAR